MCKMPFAFDDVAVARDTLRGVAYRTPLVVSTDLLPQRRLYLKAENLQYTHAFKFRGAYNRVHHLAPDQRRKGLIAASSGNHALGLSLAGRRLSAPVTVVMPDNAPLVKEAGCRAYGAEVIRHGETYDDALAFAQEMAEKRALTYVQSFDDPIVAAGQATVTWEIAEDLPEIDTLILPIGGGGLATGALGFLQTAPIDLIPGRDLPWHDVCVIGVQAEGAAAMVDSVRGGRRITLPKISTIADGIAVRQPGALTYRTVASYIDEVVTVTDEEMLLATGLLAWKEKLVVEPAGAAAVAAALKGRGTLVRRIDAGCRIGCILSGGNLAQDVLLRAIALAGEE